MSFDYIRCYYSVPAKRGGRVEWTTSKGLRTGVITHATNYVYVKFDDAKFSVPLHPKEDGLRYIEDHADLAWPDVVQLVSYDATHAKTSTGDRREAH